MTAPSATESTLVDIEELEALAKEATPGPWCTHPNGTSVWEGPDWEAVNYAKARVQNSRHVCNATKVDLDAVDDLPEHLRAEQNIRRLDRASREVAAMCERKAKGK